MERNQKPESPESVAVQEAAELYEMEPCPETWTAYKKATSLYVKTLMRSSSALNCR